MKVNNYFVAGLDFMFDRKGKPWFIEANYAPGGSTSMEKAYGKDILLQNISKFLKKQGDDIALIDHLLNELHAFTGPNQEQEDDITIVGVKRYNTIIEH